MSETTSNGNVVTFTTTTIVLHSPLGGKPDPEYDLVPRLSDEPPKKGHQCGECGMKFEYGKSYGYHCGSYRCPMGWGW